MKNKFNQKLLLSYCLGVIAYLICYSIPKFIVDLDNLYYPVISLDDKIPFLSWTILIYIAAFFQWINAVLIGSKQDTKTGYRISSAIIIGSFIGFLCFVFIPTGTVRSTFEVNSIFDYLMKITTFFDSKANACPSFHCFCSTIVILILGNCKDLDKKYLWLNVIFSLLIFISTVTTKQHNFIDIPCGVLLALLAYVISKYIRFDTLFDKLYQRLKKKL